MAFDPDVAFLAQQSLVGARREREEDDRVVLRVPMPDEHALAALILQYGPDAEVIAPRSLRAEIVRRLEAIGA